MKCNNSPPQGVHLEHHHQVCEKVPRVWLPGAGTLPVRPLSLLRFSLLRFLDSSFPGYFLWT